MIVRNGAFYGTTPFLGGGCRHSTYGCGTVFSITPSGHETVLHRFTGSPDGSTPGVLHNVNGTLYGTTSGGGSHVSVNCTLGCGTVFTITPSGKEKVLYSFRGGTDGVGPIGGVIDVNGTLYGTTLGQYGGSNGTVFSVTPGGKEKVLYSFGAHGNDGTDPSGLVDVNGTLYGSTTLGGSNVGFCASSGCGTVFSITPSGKETVLHSFSGGDGADPEAALLNVNGTLYGTTSEGGAYGLGTVFRITLSGHETVLYSFKGYGQDGENPYSGVIDVNGTLYGTTERGGGNVCYGKGCGTVFSIAL
jgi:uncharacterized repeat protein (TIGR03803 family)